jgi:myosin heavy subunit
VRNSSESGDDSVAVRGNEALKIAARLLQVPIEHLAKALTQKKIIAGGEVGRSSSSTGCIT